MVNLILIYKTTIHMQNTRSIKTVLLTTYECIERRCEE